MSPHALLILLCLGSSLWVSTCSRTQRREHRYLSNNGNNRGWHPCIRLLSKHSYESTHLILLKTQQTKSSKSKDQQKCSLNHFLESAWLLLSCLKPALPLYVSLSILRACVAQVALNNAVLVALSCKIPPDTRIEVQVVYREGDSGKGRRKTKVVHWWTDNHEVQEAGAPSLWLPSLIGPHKH